MDNTEYVETFKVLEYLPAIPQLLYVSHTTHWMIDDETWSEEAKAELRKMMKMSDAHVRFVYYTSEFIPAGALARCLIERKRADGVVDVDDSETWSYVAIEPLLLDMNGYDTNDEQDHFPSGRKWTNWMIITDIVKEREDDRKEDEKRDALLRCARHICEKYSLKFSVKPA